MMKHPATPTAAAPTPDEILVRSGAAGDVGAFEELIRRHQDSVYQFVTWYIGSTRHDAEDLAQDVFLQVCRSAGSFQGRSSFKTWLFGIARNLCHRRLRGQRRQAAESTDEATLHRVPDYRPTALDVVVAEDLTGLVRDSVERLPEHQRLVLALRDREEMSYEDIAGVLDIPVGTVRSRLHNARAALAGFIRPSLEETT